MSEHTKDMSSSQPNNRILLTGATGFVGSVLVRQLVDSNFEVRALLRSDEQRSRLPAAIQTDAVVGDLHDRQSLSLACDEVNTIIHLGGIAHVSSDRKTDEKNSAANFKACENLLAAALEQNVRRLVFLSSTLAEAAASDSGDNTLYGQSKYKAEQLFLSAAQQAKIEVIILRAVNVYGVGMKGNIASMISMIDRGRLPRLPALANKISLLGVADLAEILTRMISTSQTNKVYTATDGCAYPIATIEEAIYGALGKRIPRWRTPAVVLYAASVTAGFLAKLSGRESGISGRTYKNLTRNNVFENTALCADLGFEPRQTFYQVLPDIVDQIHKRDGSSK